MDSKYAYGIKQMKDVFNHEENVIPFFNSLDILRDYLFAMREQSQKEKAAEER